MWVRSASNFVRKMSIRLFEEVDHATVYSKFRPCHPESLVQFIVSYCKEKLPPFGKQQSKIPLAVDIGCGSGQSTSLFASHCRKIIGFDISAAQIDQAKINNSKENVEFMCCPAEELPVADESVSLVTCAQAFHWFDQDNFYKEVDRILVPGGVLAIFGHHLNEFEKDSCNRILQEFAFIKLKDYWDKQRRMIDEGYKDVTMPYKDQLRRDDFKSVINSNLADYIGYLSTISAYRKYIMKHPNEPVLRNIEQEFCKAIGVPFASADVDLKVIRRYFLLICRKPILDL